MGNLCSKCRQATDPDLRLAQFHQTIVDNFPTGVPFIDSSLQTFGAVVGGNIIANNLAITNYPHYPVLRQLNRRSKFRFNIPTPTPHYKGREDTLQDIQRYFTNLPENTSSCWDQIVAIVGLGGMGKTETAYKFAAEFQAKFPNAAWINAETKEAILDSFLGLAKHLGIVSQDQSSADVNLVKEVYRQMDQANCDNVLLIFDNAIKLGSAADESGILDYLPTDSLPNGRLPNIIITTQTQDWGRHIKTFQVGGLSEEESLAFYQSCFKVPSTKCTEEFKKLHVLLEGYPLVMSLAVSQIDFDPDRDSVDRLKQQLCMYINVFEEKQKELLHEKVDPVRGNKYDKTLSTVWKITCERLIKYPNGPEALEVVQIMSFVKLPIDSEAVARIFFSDSEQANLSEEECRLRLEELIRVLDKFHIAKILHKTYRNQVCQDDQDVNWCCGTVIHRLSQLVQRQDAGNGQLCQHDVENCHYEVGIHRLIQLLVREQRDCTKIIERVLCYLIYLNDFKSEGGVNTALLFTEMAQKNLLSSRSLTYLGILTCQGNPQACQVFKTREPKTEAAVTLWSCYNCIQGDSTCVDEVLGKLCLLITSKESLRDRQLFAHIMLKVLLANDSKAVDSLDGIEELLTNSILRECSIDDLNPEFAEIDRKVFYTKLRDINTRMLKAFIKSDPSNPRKIAGRLAESSLAILQRLKFYNPMDLNGKSNYWKDFWFEIYKVFRSPDGSHLKLVELVRCLWDRGLDETLVQAFQLLENIGSPDSSPWPPCRSVFQDMETVLICLEVCLKGMKLKDEHVQAFVLAFLDYLAEEASSIKLPKYVGMPYACALWIKLLLMDDEPPSRDLLQSWSRVKYQPWIKISLESGMKRLMDNDQYSCWTLPKEYFTEYFPQFILKQSLSEDSEIQHLVLICRQMMEVCEVQKY